MTEKDLGLRKKIDSLLKYCKSNELSVVLMARGEEKTIGDISGPMGHISHIMGLLNYNYNQFIKMSLEREDD